MNSISILGKYLDQPKLVGKFSKAIPAILITGGSVYALNHVRKSPEEERKKELIKSVAVLIGTISSAFIATRGIRAIKIGEKTIFKGFNGLSEKINLKEISKEQSELINKFLKHNQVSVEIKRIFDKAKGKILNFSEVKTLFNELSKNKSSKKLLDELIPNPENINSKEIFSEIGRLSVMGLIPVLGGIAGGVIGDKLTEKDWKERIPNKIKEGTYQYLANIFLCNVGAGVALWCLEKVKVSSKSVRAAGMIAGITLAGLVFGSAIANLIGKTCIDPLLHPKSKDKHNHVDLYSERKPEILDISLHIDDVSTVAVLSGLKWIEPALPFLYSISGYRAGIGYRNGDEKLAKTQD